MKPQERKAREAARKALAKGKIYYNPSKAHGVDGPNIEHTEDTLWPYYVMKEK